MIRTADANKQREIIESFAKGLNSFTAEIPGSAKVHPVCCAVCDSIPKQEHDWEWVDITLFAKYGHNHNLEKRQVQGLYPAELLDQYTVNDARLDHLCLSRRTVVNNVNDTIICCKECLEVLSKEVKRKLFAHPPKNAIINAYLIGDAPTELTCLSEVELSLISQSRILCQSWVFYGGCHQHIKGWHTLFKNSAEKQVANLQQLSLSGLKGQIMVVLCGPFTSTQRAITLKKTAVDPKKVIAAYEWLKKHNHYYKDVDIPSVEEIPLPVIIEENIQLTSSENVNIENQCTISVIFPDNKLPTGTNGVFSSQEEFREYIVKNQQGGQWDSQLHSRPTAERIADYCGCGIVQAFPLIFPFGFSGLPDDPAVEKLKSQKRKKHQASRTYLNVLEKCLQLSKPEVHGPLFNLIVSNIILKNIIFQSSQIHANVRRSDGSKFAEAVGQMKSSQLEEAIRRARSNNGIMFSNNAASRYLSTIKATCKEMPHTNEASLHARKVYFSYLLRFGLPAIFLTITPDDARNFRICIYAYKHDEMKFGDVDVSKLSKEDLLFHFNFQKEARAEHPGLCAEEYKRIMDLVIKHMFQWDEDEQKNTGPGIFGELVAWCLATEEQGRKTLHGHFLLFIKNWNAMRRIIQEKKETPERNEAIKNCLAFFDEICSTSMFPETDGMGKKSKFYHDNCRNARQAAQSKFTCDKVSDQNLREMRHKEKCREHDGKIAFCKKCEQEISIDDIVRNAMKIHLGEEFGFPDHLNRLDRYVYESQKDFNWYERSKEEIQTRYLASNIQFNLHNKTHATRCFKKGSECFANLPEGPCESSFIQYCEEPDVWTNIYGQEEENTMFRINPKRGIADAYTNQHNPLLTKLLCCNTNVMFGLSGVVVLYVTGYNAKCNQEEERKPFEQVSEKIINVLERKEENILNGEHIDSDYLNGFRTMLAGVYTHTNGHILAAPMAHYLALHKSRFRYSHSVADLSVYGLDAYMKDENMVMSFKMVDGKQVVYHKCMDYMYRPLELEDMCPYEFIEKAVVILRSTAKKEDMECFEFLKDHPLHKSNVVVYRDHPAVPILTWNWMTKSDGLGDLTKSVAVNHEKFLPREEYCRRFLLLFSAYRKTDTLKGNSEKTHQEKYREVISEETIKEEYKRIAENIQDIHNSMKSKLPENVLMSTTELVEDLSEEEKENNEEYNMSAEMENFLSGVGSFIASTSQQNALQEEATDVKLSFARTKNLEVPVADEEPAFVTSDDSPSPAVNSSSGSKSLERFRVSTQELNSLLMSSHISTTMANQTYNVNANGTAESIVMHGKECNLDSHQQLAYEILTATYVLTFFEDAKDDGHTFVSVNEEKIKLEKMTRRENKPGPLRMLVTGPAGAGKSAMLAAMESYCRRFSKNINHNFTADTIKKSSMTGSSATDIGGDTTARMFGLRNQSDRLAQDMMDSFADCRLCIIDEVGFMDYKKDLKKLSKNMQGLSECRDEIYGNIAIVFLGDFHQLEPIGGDTLYNHPNCPYWEQALNVMVELKGTHRFSNCPIFQEVMPNLRDGNNIELMKSKLNERVVDGDKVKLPEGKTAQFATYRNAERCDLNASNFKSYLEQNHSKDEDDDIPTSALIIKSTAKWGRSKKKLSFGQRKILFENCDESQIENSSRKKADPFLCLYTGIEVMVTENKDVKNGIANGTTAKFKKAVLKPHAKPTKMKLHGYWTYCIDIEDVDYLLLEWIDSDYFSGTFKMKAQTGTFTVKKYPVVDMGQKMLVKASIELVHFSIAVNIATTGHKLQGKSVDILVVAEWSKVANWAYVVLSRVRTFNGLYLLKPIPDDIMFEPDENCLAMEKRLRKRILVEP